MLAIHQLFAMFYVYLLRSVQDPNNTYDGFTQDLKKRFKAHNSGQSIHTSRHKPWNLVTYLAFDSEERARAFEKYFESRSGMAFANKSLW